MTKEELIKNQFPNDEFLRSAVSQIVDKCTAELEATNKKISDECHKLVDSLEKEQKENAELKEQISTKDILMKELQEQKVYWKESSFDWRHKFFKKGSTKRLVQKDEQLTKAKDLLAKWVELFKPKSETALPTPIQVDTEQFISEVEK